MKRRLRIAVSVFFALVALALCVLWVRSYSLSEYAFAPIGSSRTIVLKSSQGQLTFIVWHNTLQSAPWMSQGWGADSLDADPLKLASAEFEVGCENKGCFLLLPHWVGIVVAGAFAAAASFVGLRRFSLRTLLIVTTLVAVVLGLTVYATRAPKSPPFDHVDVPEF